MVACAHELAAGNDTRAARLAECQDQRSLLTVEPLRFALALRPRWIALEQVPGVLELWSLFAGLLAAHGYHTVAGVLRAECYGVPQTRRRAFLIASLDGPVSLPAPTHRSYDARRTKIPTEERDLQPWVSMAQALGCHPGGVVHTNNQTNGGRRPCGLSRSLGAPARTLDTASRQWTLHPPGAAWGMRNRRWYPECVRGPAEPAPTITARGNQSWVDRRPATTTRDPQAARSVTLTIRRYRRAPRTRFVSRSSRPRSCRGSRPATRGRVPAAGSFNRSAMPSRRRWHGALSNRQLRPVASCDACWVVFASRFAFWFAF